MSAADPDEILAQAAAAGWPAGVVHGIALANEARWRGVVARAMPDELEEIARQLAEGEPVVIVERDAEGSEPDQVEEDDGDEDPDHEEDEDADEDPDGDLDDDVAEGGEGGEA